MRNDWRIARMAGIVKQHTVLWARREKGQAPAQPEERLLQGRTLIQLGGKSGGHVTVKLDGRMS